jgi:hypothetical protein
MRGTWIRPQGGAIVNAQRTLTKEDKDAIDELAMRFFESTGDIMAVSHSIRNVILARFEWIKQHGKDAGE